MTETNESPDVVYGRMLEGAHLSGYAFDRALGSVEYLLEDDRWRRVGPGFDNVNDFLRSMDLSAFNLGDRRPQLHQRIKELQPDASNRAIADMTGVNETTVRRDLAASNNADIDETSGKTPEEAELHAANAAPAPEDARDPEDRHSLPVLGGYITLPAWEAMKARERKAALQPGGMESTFNAQGKNEKIEWALWSWNPVTGCLHNCPYCYARDIADRFYEQKFAPSLWPSRLAAPANTPFPEAKAAEWMGHKNVFVCSMADLFGRWVPAEWIDAVLAACKAAPQWNFLFLTKFPVRMAEFTYSDNCWLGTTVDCQARVANAEKAFRKVKAGVKWLSCEPLIEPLKFKDIGAFQWVVLGGASPSSRTPEWEPPSRWVVDLDTAARNAGCRVYHKSNLGRVREYPGPEEEKEAPASLRYLPEVLA